MPKSLIFGEFMLLICEKHIANYALLRCKTFSLKIWLCKILDKYHVCIVDPFTFAVASTAILVYCVYCSVLRLCICCPTN